MHLICDVIYIIHQTPFIQTQLKHTGTIGLKYLAVSVCHCEHLCWDFWFCLWVYEDFFWVVLNVQWIIKWTGFKVQFVHLSCSNPDTLQSCTSYGFYIKVGTRILDRKIKSCLFLVCVKWIYACKSDERCEEVKLSLNEYGRWPSLRI